ncbi:MAG: 1-deoxy-D-xylulose-5-phosphate reductoisomerase [Pseudohongiellaceae bacterium]
MTRPLHLTILGSTGSVGQNTLDVVAGNPGFEVFALSAHQNIDLLLEQAVRFAPRYVVVSDPARVDAMAALLREHGVDATLLSGQEGLSEVSAHADVDAVMAAIVGAAGLPPTLAAVAAGKRVLLANKEALVMAGELFMQAVADAGAEIIPIDSEHNAIFQCLPRGPAGDSRANLEHVARIVLTASGGPFLSTPLSQMTGVTPDQACRHPKWRMGRKISVDSATMMNKGLEFIEACYLFDLAPEQVEVLIHPQSIIHSMVYYRDGSVLAQLANPDMRIPIAYGLSFPERIASGADWLDLAREEPLEFMAPDLERFPCLALGMAAARAGGTATVALNAANEVAVAAFLDNKLAFTRIPLIIEDVLSKIPCEAATSLAIIQDCDSHARNLAKELIIKEFH